MDAPYSTHCVAIAEVAYTLACVQQKIPNSLSKIIPVEQDSVLYFHLLWGDHGDMDNIFADLDDYFTQIGQQLELATPVFGASCMYSNNNDNSIENGHWGDPWYFGIDSIHTFDFPAKPKEES